MTLSRRRCFIAGLREAVLVFVGTFVVAAQTCGAATSHEVAAALDRAKNYLYQQEKTDNWEESPAPVSDTNPAGVTSRQWGGLTSIAVYALLAAGENPQDPRLAPAIEWLKKATIRGVYAAGIRSQVWTFLPPKETRTVAQTDLETLTKAMWAQGPGKGLYPYYIDEAGTRGPPGRRTPDYFDFSVSQYGVLGMWALEEAGMEVSDKYWQSVDAAWKAAQQRDGGWPYHLGSEVEPTMTAAGIATLYITQDHLLINHHWDPCIGGETNRYLDKGLAYMDQHIGELLDGNYYGMYGVERIGVASGRKYFGTTDWYARGAEFIVRHQGADGSWTGKYPTLANTAFAMLFLTRGRAPVMMNKLQWSAAPRLDGGKIQPEPWNERPRDLANLAQWSGKEIETYLNWQTVDLSGSADDLHDSAILYVSGSQPLSFDDASIAKLRDFVAGGGLILGNADCANTNFADSFMKLGSELFPKYEFRQLPPTHPIFKDEEYSATRWSERPKVLGLSNQVRELMLLIPEADVSRAWQTRSDKIRQEDFELGQDIFLYSVDKSNLIDRGESYVVRPNPSIKPTVQLKLARLQLGDNPDPEPGGWPRLAAILHNWGILDLNVQNVKPDDSNLAGFKIAHLTGTTRFTLNDAQRHQLKAFVNGGGTLIVDAAGGNAEFADSAEAELAAIFGGSAADLGTVLPPDSPVYQIAGAQIALFRYRPFTKNKVTGHLDAPRIRGITVGSRIGVFYSREDLTAGLVGQPVDGIIGYTPDSATALMRNIVLYAAQIKNVPAPATQPAPATAPSEPPAPDQPPQMEHHRHEHRPH